MRKLVLVVAMVLGGSSSAFAQWHAPSFLPPRAGSDLGIYVTDKYDWGLAGIWRQTGNLNLGVRGGIVDTPGDMVVEVGVETWSLIAPAGSTFPLDIGWTLGAGASFGNGLTYVSIPAGLNIGARLGAGTMVLTPYVHPRIHLDIASYDDGVDDDDSDADLGFSADIGVDLQLSPAAVLRFGAALGDADAIGIGLAIRMDRGVSVR